MTAVVPDLVMIKPLAYTVVSGTTERRLVEAYIECSGAVSDTVAAATYVPNLSAIAVIDGFSSKAASIPTWSGTAITLAFAGAQAFTIKGYYD